MVEFHINKGPGDSVIGAQIEKNYAFIEVIDIFQILMFLKIK